MTRPTKDELDLAMRHLWCGDAADRAVPILQAEVRALRLELASVNTETKRVFAKEFKAELLERSQECDKLRATIAATIARVEALPEEWRIRGNEDALGEADAVRGMDTADLRCADELERALKGPTP